MASRYQQGRSTPATLQRECAGFNAEIKVGDAVAYQEVMREDCPVQVFTTKTEAQIMSGHSAVVWLNGKSGCVLISHCRKATPEDVAAAQRAEAIAAEQAAKDAAAVAQFSATPYYVRPDAFMKLRAGTPALCRKADVLSRTDIRLYEQGFVDALVKSVRELMLIATRIDVPMPKQIEIAERAQDLLDKFQADEPVPF